MAVNKVEFNSDTLIDLTEDTVTPQTLDIGVTAHNRSGAAITGTADHQPKTLTFPVSIGSGTAATVESAISAIADIIPASASPANKAAVISDLTAERIFASVTGTRIAITDCANAKLVSIGIKGRSEVISGETVSVGDNGLTVTTSDSGNTSTSSAVISTGLPLRSYSESVYDELDSAAGRIITRCGFENGEVTALAEPVTTELTSAEKAALNALRTYDGTTNIAATDSPEMTVGYIRNTYNGKAAAALADKADLPTVSQTLTLAANGWSSDQQTVTFAHDTTKRNVIDITPSEIENWAASGVYACSETSSGITFKCGSVPAVSLTFRVTSMGVSE